MKLIQWLKMSGLIAIFAVSVIACGGQAVANDQKVATSESSQPEPEAKGAPVAFDGKPAPGTKAKCLVMGAEFTVNETTEFSTYKGKTYVFCCPGCKPKFDKNPEKFLAARTNPS